MSSVVISGDSSGSITLSAPAAAGSNTVTLPAATGTIELIGRATAVSASGTSVNFTGIPSWAKKITVMCSGLSSSGTSAYLIQLGDSGGVETTGYVSVNASQSGTLTTSTAGFLLGSMSPATDNGNGLFTIATLGSNSWVESGVLSENGTSRIFTNSSSKTLSDTLTSVRITTVNGTDTFDAGTINIMYEG